MIIRYSLYYKIQIIIWRFKPIYKNELLLFLYKVIYTKESILWNKGKHTCGKTIAELEKSNQIYTRFIWSSINIKQGVFMMVNCGECEELVSDKAESCLNCGNPINKKQEISVTVQQTSKK